MSTIEAIILGIVQGITEFLPISSTGHVTLTGKLMNLISNENPEKWTSFLAIIQLGTLLAVLIYFWKDIINIFRDFIIENINRRKTFSDQSLNSKLGWLIILGSIPIFTLGILFKELIEGPLTKNLYVITFSILFFAALLALAEKIASFKKEMKDISVKDALLIGLAQVFSLVPGASRSGVTMTGGMFVGLNREAAARFSFLISIPAVFASGLFQLSEALSFLDSSMIESLVIATIFSALSGYLAIDFLLKFLKKRSTFIFVYYRVLLGILIIVLLFSNIINP
ncbi:MAG: undecaprenyl-diphosphatase UppP [Ignavibacteriaceae bacterium]|nr:undecaprenyl-diphosphatase UppP [Ignavibacteriaceae bacterium]